MISLTSGQHGLEVDESDGDVLDEFAEADEGGRAALGVVRRREQVLNVLAGERIQHGVVRMFLRL